MSYIKLASWNLCLGLANKKDLSVVTKKGKKLGKKRNLIETEPANDNLTTNNLKKDLNSLKKPAKQANKRLKKDGDNKKNSSSDTSASLNKVKEEPLVKETSKYPTSHSPFRNKAPKTEYAQSLFG